MISRQNLLSQKLGGESDQMRARFEVLTAVLMKFSAFWDVTLYVLVYSHRLEYRYMPIYTASLPREWNLHGTRCEVLTAGSIKNIFRCDIVKVDRYRRFVLTSRFPVLDIVGAVRLESADSSENLIPMF
jgi:hypothetical protein